MLRINLLPSYVTQRRLTKRLVPVFALILLACIAGPLAYYAKLQGDLKDLTTQADAAETGKGKTDALKAQATTTLAQVGPIKDKLQFVDDAHAYARKWVALYNTLAETSPRSSFIYSGAQVSGPTMNIKAYSPSVEEVGRYLQVMYHEPDFQTVAVDKVPGYPDNVRHFYYLDGVLVFADGATGGSGAGGGGFPGGGFGGGRGGFPGGRGGGGFPGGGFSGGGGGGQAAGAPANWTAEALGPNGPTNLPPGVGPPPAELTGGTAAGGTGGFSGGRGGFPGGRGGGGFPGGGGGFPGGGGGFPGGGGGFPGGGAQAGSGGYSPKFLQVALRDFGPFAPADVRDRALVNALHRIVTKTVPKGFDINVTATLKEPLTPPSAPGSAPAAGTTGGFPSGFPGGGPPGGFPGGGPPGGVPGGRSGPPASAASSG